jgi:Thiamine pyrophosphate enzyme, N-terminal TPP binding domain
MAFTISDLVVETLERAGVRRVYGLPGDFLNGLTDALRRSGSLAWEDVRHEEAAAFAGAADTAITGELAVCAEHVAAREGEAPDRDPGRVDSRQGRGEGDPGLPIGNLLADELDLAGLSAAVPEMAVVEGEHREPGGVEPPREQVGAWVLRHREPTGHDHAGAVGARVVPRSALRISAGEANLFPLNGHLEAVSLDDGGHRVAPG